MAPRSTLSQIFSGLGMYFRVPKTLFHYRLWHFQILPALISLVVSSVLFTVFYFSAGGFSKWMDKVINIPIEWLDQAVTVAAAVLSFVALVAGFIFVHKHLVLIVLAPFLGKIAEETLKAVKGDDYVKSPGMKDSVARSVKINLRYIIRELFINLAFLVGGLLIPVIGSGVSTVGMFVTQARFLGYGLMDFPLENRGFSVLESEQFVKSRNGMSVGLGAGYLILMMIPVVGWMFAPTFGTVAGTLKAIEELEIESGEKRLS